MAAAGPALAGKTVADAASVLRVEKSGVAQDQLGPVVSATAINLLVFAAENGAKPGVGFTVHRTHGASCDIVVCLPVDKSIEGRGDIKCEAVAGGEADAAVFTGTYDQFYGADDVLTGKYGGSSGAKEVRLYYNKGPKEAPKDPSSWETELVYLK